MKDRKTKTFIFKGLGFPIKLINVPMKKEFGEWYIDINMNKLMLVVFGALPHKPMALTAGELSFIRSYLQMTSVEFGKAFGVSHAAVLKWESGENRVSPSLELCIRLYVLDHLRAQDAEFRALYKEVSLEKLSKEKKNEKIHPIVVDATTEDLKIAL
jgi:DNA-binding transcriptional regulator YiaG